MTSRTPDMTEGLRQLLEDQRRALRAGRFEELGTILRRLERLIQEVCEDGSPRIERSAAEGLHRLAAGNAGMIEAAKAGLAQVRMLRDPAARPVLSTYDAAGRKAPSNPGHGRILTRR